MVPQFAMALVQLIASGILGGNGTPTSRKCGAWEIAWKLKRSEKNLEKSENYHLRITHIGLLVFFGWKKSTLDVFFGSKLFSRDSLFPEDQP